MANTFMLVRGCFPQPIEGFTTLHLGVIILIGFDLQLYHFSLILLARIWFWFFVPI